MSSVSSKCPPNLPMTHWSMVRRAFPLSPQQRQGVGYINSQNEFCRIYWPVINLSLRHKHGFSHHDAEDLSQGFLTWVFSSGCLEKSREEKGRFRSFLLAHLDGFVSNFNQKMQRERRGGKVHRVPLTAETEEILPSNQLTPDLELHRAWSIATLREAHQRTHQLYCQRGKETLFHALLPFLTTHEDEGQAVTAAAKLNMSLPAFRMARSRFRKEFGQFIADLVAATVETEAEFNEEMQAIRDLAG